MIRPLRCEIRHSPMLVALPLLVAVHAFTVFAYLRPGVTAWPDSSAELAMATLVSGPVAAGVAAVGGLREHRRRTAFLRVLSSRDPAAGPLLELVALLFWTVLGYLLVLAALATRQLTAADPWGRPEWLWIGAGLGGLLCHVVLGYVAGRAFPTVWTAPVTAIVLYLVTAWNQARFGEVGHYLSLVTVALPSLYDTVNNGLLLRQMTWYLGLAILIVAVLAISRLGSRGLGWSVVAGVGVVIAIGGAAAVLVSDPLLTDRRVAFDHACSSAAPGRVAVCVHPAFRGGLPRLVEEFDGLAARLKDTPVHIDRVEQQERRGQTRYADGVGMFAVDDLGEGFATAAVLEYVQDVVFRAGDQLCSQTPAADAATKSEPAEGFLRLRYQEMIVGWLAESHDPFPQASEEEAIVVAQRRLEGWTEEERVEWFGENYERALRCELTAEDFR